MHSISTLITRSHELLHARNTTAPTSSTETPISMIDLLIALMVLIFISLLLGGVLYTFHKIRRARLRAEQQLPMYNHLEPGKNTANHRRLTITATPYGRASNIYIYDEKSRLSSPSSPPLTPDNVPEIRITFPDEQDESGRKKSGRVLIVRVGENGIGLEPMNDEQLPAYEKETGQKFHSIDMNRIGGLKEKSSWS